MKPRLAVAYDGSSASPLQIMNALGDECELVWLVDSATAGVGPLGRLLERTGSVVDLAGRPVGAVSELGPGSVDGVAAFTDSQLPTAAALAELLGLPGNGREVTERLLDKVRQRRALAEAGIDVPGLVEIDGAMESSQLRASVEPLKFPAICKPRAGSGSRDTYHLESPEDLVSLFRRERLRTAGERFVIEEYLSDRVAPAEQVVGDYVSVEGVAVDGVVHNLAITGKFPLAEPYRETGNFLPSGLDESEALEAAELAARAAEALGVRWGCLHTEVKLTPEGPRLIEVNARVAGGGIDDLYAARHGQPLLRVAGRAALGQSPSPGRGPRDPALVYQLFVQPPSSARRVSGIDGLARIRAIEGVAQVYVARGVGDEVDWHLGSQGYVLTVRGSVPDHPALLDRRDEILELLEITYE